MSKIKHHIIVLLQIVILTAFVLLPSKMVRSSGQHVHIHMADTAIAYIGNSEIRGIIEDRRDLFKFASLFPDTYQYDKNGPNGGGDDATIIHSPQFFDQYARAIRDECFLTPVGTSSCSFRQDIQCEPLTLGNCDVPGSRVCSKDLRPCTPSASNPINGDCPQNGGLNVCADRGVCSDNFTTTCAQTTSFGFPSPQCPDPSFGDINECFDNYGFCQTNFDAKCERLVTHFMGALAHLVSDINADKFFMRTVFEREDCPGLDEGDETTNSTNPAQFYTDQDMDPYLARADIGLGTPLHDLLPGLPGRTQIEDTFLEEEVLSQIVSFNRPEEVASALNRQYFLGMPNKTDEDGNTFGGFICSEVPKSLEGTEASCESREQLPGISCIPFGKVENTCDVRECTIKSPNGLPVICRTNDDCPGDTNLCEESETAGVCSNDYEAACRENSDCDGIFGGVFNTCSKDYGYCQLVERVKRPTCHEDCKWAIEDDHWYTEAGGTDDTAREIAKMIDEAWLPMRRGAILKFRMVGKFPDRHLCVGTTDKDCLQEKSLQIIGTAP